MALSILCRQRPPGTYPQWDEMSLTLIAAKQSAHCGIMWGISERTVELKDSGLSMSDFGAVPRKEG